MSPEPDLVFPPFRLALAQEQLWRGTERVPLRPKAFAVLRYLVAHAPRLVTQAEVLQAVWGGAYVRGGLLGSYIRELWTGLGEAGPAPRFFETVVRRGCRFLPPVPVAASPPLLPAPEAPPPLPRAGPPASEGLPSVPTTAMLAEEYKLVTSSAGSWPR